MDLRTTILVACALIATAVQSQNSPRILTPEEPAPRGPTYHSVVPQRENPQHFVARARDLLPIVREHPAAPGFARYDFVIEGVRIWPASAFTPESLRLLDEEEGSFDARLRDRMLNCNASPAPADSQVLVINTRGSQLPVVPVFLDPDSKELSYIELSIDHPGPPVLVVVTSYDGLAVRVTTSRRTRLAGVRLSSYYPGVVLGVDPALVSQRTQHRSSARSCAIPSLQPSLTTLDPPFDKPGTKTYKANGAEYQLAIGEPQAVKRKAPKLGNFLDPEMPVPNQHGLVVLAARGYIIAIPPLKEGAGITTGRDTYEVLKPFRIPNGLAGGHSVTFLLREGIETPSGDIAHSRMVKRID